MHVPWDRRNKITRILFLTVPEAFWSQNEGRTRSAVQVILCFLCSLSQRQSRPIMRGGAPVMQSNFCIAPCFPRGSLVHYKSEEQISFVVHSLCCSSLSQRQSCPIQKRGESVLSGPSITGPGAPMGPATRGLSILGIKRNHAPFTHLFQATDWRWKPH